MVIDLNLYGMTITKRLTILLKMAEKMKKGFADFHIQASELYLYSR